jgi:hypothetical protein
MTRNLIVDGHNEVVIDFWVFGRSSICAEGMGTLARRVAPVIAEARSGAHAALGAAGAFRGENHA